MEQIKILVHGVVQGVGYRYNTRTEATELGLTGYVKNLSSGSVEIVAEGDRPQLEQLLAWAQQGPAAARVSRVEVEYAPATGEFGTFSIER